MCYVVNYSLHHTRRHESLRRLIMTLFQIKCTWNANSATYDLSIPWLDSLVKKVSGNKAAKKLVLVGVDESSLISSIKELRALTGYGLKESKEIVDMVRAGGTWACIRNISDVSGYPHLKFEYR